MRKGLSDTQNKPHYLSQIKQFCTAVKAYTTFLFIILEDAQVWIRFEKGKATLYMRAKNTSRLLKK